jgi:hypothetical protein
MPDSFPPLTWGPQFDERNLDALLSGQLADTPLALRQVADALAALRAAPIPAELAGEAAARAGFRASRLEAAAHGDELSHTLVLPAPPPGRTGKRQARHRSGRGAGGAGRARAVRGDRPGLPARPHRARPPGRRLGRRGGVLLAVAGAALIVAVIALTGNLPGKMHGTGNSSAAGKTSSTPTSAGSGSANVQARSDARDPSRKPTPSHPAIVAPSASTSSSAKVKASNLCRAYYEFFVRLQPHDKRSAEALLWQEIVQLAGGPAQVRTFCSPYVSGMFEHGLPLSPFAPPGLQQGTQNGPGDGQQGAGNGGPGPGTMNGKPVSD